MQVHEPEARTDRSILAGMIAYLALAVAAWAAPGVVCAWWSIY